MPSSVEVDQIPQPAVSIVVCVYNEFGNSTPLVEQIRQAMQGVAYELIYVNDGSTDKTLDELMSINDPNLIVLDLQKNYGQSLALAAGINEARGAYIVTLDGDQQNDPTDIQKMLEYCEARDLDLVAGFRLNRQDTYLLRKVPSRIANALIRWITGVKLRDMGCGLKVIRASLAKKLGLYGELHRFLLVLAFLEGARLAELPVNHRPRRIGQSKYGLGRTFRVVSDLVLLMFLKKYLLKPMHLFGTAGIMLAGLGIVSLLATLIMKVSNPAYSLGYAFIAELIIAMGGFQLLAFGIVTELQMRTYFESQGKSSYQIRRIYTPGFSIN